MFLIICPECQKELKRTPFFYKCSKCGYEARIKNDMIIFNPEIRSDHADYSQDKIEKLYRYEQNHFWFINRKKIIAKAIEKYVSKKEHVIEIGAGTGSIMRELIDKGYKNVSIGEIHSNGLRYAKKYGVKNLFQFDATKSPFKNHFNAIGIFDVLEHLDDDRGAVREAHKSLKRGGYLFVTVPAHMWLWSEVDQRSGHKRRYGLVDLKRLFRDEGYSVLEARYLFALILPLLLFRKVLNLKTAKNNNVLRQGLYIGRFANFFLDFLTRIEESVVLTRFITGGSILIIGRKNDLI